MRFPQFSLLHTIDPLCAEAQVVKEGNGRYSHKREEVSATEIQNQKLQGMEVFEICL